MLEHDTEVQTLPSGDTTERRHLWYSYSSTQHTDYQALIRHLDDSLSINDVLGFNNTGNVCVWPSEEVLTQHCLDHREIFRGKSVCELGGGMTCLAGIAVALCTEASDVLLTDGNQASVENLQVIVERNRPNFGMTKVSARMLRWDEPDADLEKQYDIVICADCLFFDEFRSSLADVIHKLLKPKGSVVMFAPSRGQTFDQFVDLLEPRFSGVEKSDSYNLTVSALHGQNVEKGLDCYDPNLHYPLMLTFTKT